jgi:hypothetical protein
LSYWSLTLKVTKLLGIESLSLSQAESTSGLNDGISEERNNENGFCLVSPTRVLLGGRVYEGISSTGGKGSYIITGLSEISLGRDVAKTF